MFVKDCVVELSNVVCCTLNSPSPGAPDHCDWLTRIMYVNDCVVELSNVACCTLNSLSLSTPDHWPPIIAIG